MAGEGVLTPQNSVASYHAPATIPAINPAVVTLFLNKTIKIDGHEFKDIRLVSSIFVAPEGISIQMDGGDWQTYPGGANINTTHHIVQGRNNGESCSVSWIGTSTGTFNWTKSTAVTFNLNKPKLIYQHLYGTGPFVSGGSLKVDNSDPTWVKGSFSVLPAGWINLGMPVPTMGTVSINGVIRMKRVN